MLFVRSLNFNLRKKLKFNIVANGKMKNYTYLENWLTVE